MINFKMSTYLAGLIFFGNAGFGFQSNAMAETLPEKTPEQPVAGSVHSVHPSKSKIRNLNVESNPFYLLFGGIHAAASFRVDTSMAIGPSVSTIALLGSRTTSFGVQGQYHLEEKDVMSGGLILDSAVEWVTTSFDAFGDSYRHNAIGMQSTVNWQWFYSNGFNFRLGGGIALQMALDDKVEYGSVLGSGGTSISDNLVAHLFLNGKLAWAF